jgi:hypothetical protein
MMILALMRTATGKEDPELSLLQRISALELPASEIAAQVMLQRGDCVNQAFIVKSSQIKLYSSHEPNTTGSPYSEMLTYKPVKKSFI